MPPPVEERCCDRSSPRRARASNSFGVARSIGRCEFRRSSRCRSGDTASTPQYRGQLDDCRGFLLVLAFVVDDAVSATVAVFRRLHTKGDRVDDSTTLSAKIRAGVFDHSSPAFYALVIATEICAPLLFIDGLTGEAFVPPMIRSYRTVLLASAVVVALLLPALIVLLVGNRPVSPPEPRSIRVIREKYAKMADGRFREKLRLSSVASDFQCRRDRPYPSR